MARRTHGTAPSGAPSRRERAHDVLQLLEQPRQHADAADLDALEVERHHGVVEAHAAGADQVILRHPHVVEEHRIGADVRHRPDALHLDAGTIHRHDDHRDALVLARLGLGAHRHPVVGGGVGAGVPDLLAVDHPLVTVQLGARAEGRQVGTGVGLGIGDGELDLAAQDARQPRRLLLLGALAQDGGRHRGDGEIHRRRARHLHLVDEEVLLDGRLPHAAEILRPPDAPPALLEEPLVERAGQRTVAFVAGLSQLGAQGIGDVLGAEGPHLVPPRALLGCELVAHPGDWTMRRVRDLARRDAWRGCRHPSHPLTLRYRRCVLSCCP